MKKSVRKAILLVPKSLHLFMYVLDVLEIEHPEVSEKEKTSLIESAMRVIVEAINNLPRSQCSLYHSGFYKTFLANK